MRASIETRLGRIRRRLALARLVQFALLAGVTLGLAAAATMAADFVGFAALLAVGLWVALAVRGARVGQVVREAAAALQAGNTELAERRAWEAADSFSLLRPVTLGAVQVLAGVAASQGRPAEAARLAAFVLSRPEPSALGNRHAVAFALVDSLLKLGQVEAARRGLAPLVTARLSLGEALQLLALQLRVEAGLGAWPSMLKEARHKVDLCELMPPPESARAQALLLLAAQESGGAAWVDWLRRRVELMALPSDLCRMEPSLSRVAWTPTAATVSSGG